MTCNNKDYCEKCYTFKILIIYCQEIKEIPSERITLNKLSSEWITGFLEWLEVNRKSSISNRNQRLAAIHSFFRYVQAEDLILFVKLK